MSKSKYFHFLAWPLLMSGMAAAIEVKDIHREIEANLSKIKTLSCQVEIMGVMGTGSLRHSFALEYKYPHRIRAVSSASPDLVYISRKDTSFFKSRTPKKMDESLIATIRPDAQGRLFNPIAFLGGEVTSTATPCGPRVCISFSGKVGSQVADSVKQQLGISHYSGSIEYSPEKRVVESFTLLAGPAATTSKIEYQEIAGVQVPKVMEMQMQGMRTTIRFDKVKVNAPIPDRDFR
ncbi:MAG: hypothetical protein M3Y08_05275 [Fibrobacterota bacterium]|nr:hypothetical protein [Fibrobacterota bacterium]